MRGLLIRATHDVEVIDTDATDWSTQQILELLECAEVAMMSVPPCRGEAALGLWHGCYTDCAGLATNRGASALMEGGLPIVGSVLIVGLNDGHARSLDLLELVRLCTRVVESEFQALPPGS